MTTTAKSTVTRFGLPKNLIAIAAAILAWFLVSEVATEAWYRWRESQVPVTQPWPIDWPTEENAAARGFRDFQPREMSEQEKELLHFKRGRAASWKDAKGNQWTGFYIEWDPDPKLNQMDLTHNPTVCLQAAGLMLVRSLPNVNAEIGGLPANFKAWEFEHDGKSIFVYVATRLGHGFSTFDYKRGRIAMRTGNLWKAVVGSRGNPLQTMEFVVTGKIDASEAGSALKTQLSHIIGEANPKP